MAAEIRVAIVGGSIAGCTLANALLPHRHIAWDVFEGKPTFRERGAEVSLADNAQKALRAAGVDVEQAFADAGAMTMHSTYCLVVSVPPASA